MIQYVATKVETPESPGCGEIVFALSDGFTRHFCF